MISRAFLRSAVLLFVISGSTAVAAEGEGETSVAISDVTAAALLMEAGRLDDAKAVLTRALAANPNDGQAEFLVAMIAVAQMDYDTAIAHFRAILVREPNAERVRLELARAFFLKEDFDNAARQFRFARAGDLPPEVNANVDQYLNAITRLRQWSYNFSLAFAQDTNVNAATDLSQVDIYGLPFVLSDDARKTSGTGIAVDAGGEWSPLLSETIKGRLGGQMHRAEYGGGDFDDMTLSAYAGPEFLFPRAQLVVLGTGFRRWFGNDAYNSGVGARAGLAYLLTPRVQLGASLDGQSIRFERGTEQNGWIGSASLSLAYTISPSSTVRGAGGYAFRNARADAFSSATWWSAIGYYRDLPIGFSLYVEPSYSQTRYHAPLAGFGAARHDQVWSVKTDLLNRRIDYAGFTPKLSFVFATQDSNIPLYSYDRSQFSLALTREF